MTTQLSTIQFHNQSLVTFEKDGIFYTAMKPICDNIGLDWKAQYSRIKRDEVLSQGMVIITIPSNGGEQQTLCLPIDYLNGWLFGIDVKRVKPEIRETLIMYKKECYKALADYWFKGKAERKTTTDERTGLRQAVSQLVSKKGLIYSDAYALVHQRFNVNHIDELTPEQIPMAVEYVHKVYLEGELIIDEPKVQMLALDRQQSLRIVSMWYALYNCVELLSKLYKPLHALGSAYAPQTYGCSTEYKTTLGVFKRIVEPMLADCNVDPFEDPHYYKALNTLRNYKPQGLGAIVRV
ncbi:hypothetical protein E4T80_10065 [Muribacter muris]|uniref:Antirepressor n=1 Tax=Muribacter muris TaxID=67855 RepID=A0A4Y9JVZ5_9PAST|nr:phage antirepressor N-terminal domain-containing protein [Muribacter muris]MBF0785805.1 hypothetical protein [Muribacter muris]MBF0828223.1 hypothetical protein [Muribacter muris]TFV08626.1 hypothetical protein E4T80_10065 [Muribacter muris]